MGNNELWGNSEGGGFLWCWWWGGFLGINEIGLGMMAGPVADGNGRHIRPFG